MTQTRNVVGGLGLPGAPFGNVDRRGGLFLTDFACGFQTLEAIHKFLRFQITDH